VRLQCAGARERAFPLALGHAIEKQFVKMWQHQRTSRSVFAYSKLLPLKIFAT
jgi:hypothetical protein